MGIRNRRFRGKVVYSGGIVNQRTVFQEKIDTGNPATAPQAPGGGGEGGAGLAWDPASPESTAKEFQRVYLTKGQPATRYVKGGPSIFLGGATGAESITYSATGLASGLSIDSSTGQLLGTASPVGYSNVTISASDGTTTISKSVYILERSQQLYSSSGTYTFVVPDFVDEIHAICTGGGGAGSFTPPANRGGGGGGGTRWISHMPVTPGESLTVVVGAGGTNSQSGSPTSRMVGTPGGNSSISRGPSVLLQGNGGTGATDTTPTVVNYPGGGGTPQGAKPYGFVGGGNGGKSYNPGPSDGWGGGAGGYAQEEVDGDLGTFGTPWTTFSSELGKTSAPSGGPYNGVNYILWGGGGASGRAYGGGGVGLKGYGGNAAKGVPGPTKGAPGGSGGTPGVTGAGPLGTGPGFGGTYGGGGWCRGGPPIGTTGYGGTGGVRIMWGSDRHYPGTNAGDL